MDFMAELNMDRCLPHADGVHTNISHIVPNVTPGTETYDLLFF